MTLRVIHFQGLLLLCCLPLSGCLPSARSQADEEKEPHYLAGKSRVSTMDYKGAIEAFEKALEVNPHSAAAHLELACLFDQREMDPSAAIYHYEKYLKLRSDAGNADAVKQRISTCKQELAKNVSLGPLTERQQRELESLAQQNKALLEQVKQLTEENKQWQAYAARLQTMTNPMYRPGATGGTTAPTPPAAGAGPPRSAAPTPQPGTRTHTVKAGETLTVIARKYGVRIDAISAANPNVEPRRLQVGQVLQIPGS